jgi:cyanophycinase
MSKHLFLFGGGPPFTKGLAKKFVSLTAGNKGPVSILIVERYGWESYMPLYTQKLRNLGIDEYVYLPLPSTPVHKIIECINKSCALIIGGGDTNLYANYIVNTSIKNAIQDKYFNGCPLAGFSAGALIAPTQCIISAKDNEENKFQLRNGLGLLQDTVLSVHFMEWNDEMHLREGIEKCKPKMNYGIDEDSGIYLENDIYRAAEGRGIYSIQNGKLIRIYP